MIRYTTNDIVVRARQLADLENSDFISWNENINLLNENWQKIYQKLIDNGDKTFIKEFNVDVNSRTELPDDFYELFSVELVPSCFQIHRKAKSETEKSLSYDIENNELVLFGMASEKVRVRYFPNPQTLTLKNKTTDINSNMYKDDDYSLWDCYKNRYLYTKYDTKNTIKLYSSDSHDFIFMMEDVGSFAIKNGVVGKKNCFAVTCYEDGINYNIYMKLPNVNTLKTVTINPLTKSCLLKSEGNVGAVALYNNVITLYISDKEYVINLNNRVNTDDEIGDINIDPLGMSCIKFYDEYNYSIVLPVYDLITNKSSYVQLDVNINDQTNDLYVTKTNPFPNLDFGLITDVDKKNYLNVVDGSVCVASKEYFYINNNAIFSFDDYALIGVNEINEDNGYGITVKDVYNTNHIMLHSAFIDTVLLYPNNVFFNFISILMAMSYKIKQNGDITILDAKFTEMENQYFDSLSRDVNNVVRITNVY